MNINEAIEYLKQKPYDNSVYSTSIGKTYWFSISNDFKFVHSGCPGEYPCCHNNYTLEEFLDTYKDDEFEVK